jgi:hypothetical protein
MPRRIAITAKNVDDTLVDTCMHQRSLGSRG